MKAFYSTLFCFAKNLVLTGIISATSTAALAQDSSDELNVESSVAAPAESQSKNAADRPIEEILVIAEQSFFLLNNQIEYATERLYSIYSDLNEIEEFDVSCRNSDWTGTHIRVQECWPHFFDEIVTKNSQDSRMGLDSVIPVNQLKRIHQDKFDELRANIVRVASENSSAAEALIELGKLEKAREAKKESCKEQPAFLFVLRLCH